MKSLKLFSLTIFATLACAAQLNAGMFDRMPRIFASASRVIHQYNPARSMSTKNNSFEENVVKRLTETTGKKTWVTSEQRKADIAAKEHFLTQLEEDAALIKGYLGDDKCPSLDKTCVEARQIFDAYKQQYDVQKPTPFEDNVAKRLTQATGKQYLTLNEKRELNKIFTGVGRHFKLLGATLEGLLAKSTNITAAMTGDVELLNKFSNKFKERAAQRRKDASALGIHFSEEKPTTFIKQAPEKFSLKTRASNLYSKIKSWFKKS